MSRFFDVTCSQLGWHWVRCIDCERVAALKAEHGEWLPVYYAVTAYNRPRSQALDVDIIGILLALARTSGAWATWLLCRWSHVTITFGCSNFHDMTNCITEIPEVGIQLPEWGVTLHLYLYLHVPVWGKRLHTLPSHLWLGWPQSLNWETVTNNNSKHRVQSLKFYGFWPLWSSVHSAATVFWHVRTTPSSRRALNTLVSPFACVSLFVSMI